MTVPWWQFSGFLFCDLGSKIGNKVKYKQTNKQIPPLYSPNIEQGTIFFVFKLNQTKTTRDKPVVQQDQMYRPDAVREALQRSREVLLSKGEICKVKLLLKGPGKWGSVLY